MKKSEQIPLFETPTPVIATTPGQAVRVAARRREWKKRQRKHRALQKASKIWTTPGVTTPGVTTPGVTTPGVVFGPAVQSSTDAEIYLCGALTLRREFMDRISQLLSPSMFSEPTLRLIAEVAFEIHARGARVTRDGILNDLKKSGVLLLGGKAAIDAAISILPNHVTLADLDSWAGWLKEAS